MTFFANFYRFHGHLADFSKKADCHTIARYEAVNLRIGHFLARGHRFRAMGPQTPFLPISAKQLTLWRHLAAAFINRSPPDYRQTIRRAEGVITCIWPFFATGYRF